MTHKRFSSIDDLKRYRTQLAGEILRPDRMRIRACCGPACSASGSHQVVSALNEEIGKSGLDIEIVTTGCHGMCQRGPNARIEPHGFYYQGLKPEHAGQIIDRTFRAKMPVRENLFRENPLVSPKKYVNDIPFYRRQVRIALRNLIRIDPTRIDHYIRYDGYASLAWALANMTPEQVLREIEKSNLRGRGGAGFPAGQKWRHTSRARNKTKVIIANGDEGDPGAFMDRAIMEGDPHSLIEGMLLCAYAIGAQFGYIYVRHEYPLAVKHLTIAIEQAKESGLLGENILGSGFGFELFVREGAGAYVCGESTALVASIEGERGYPRPRPPRLSDPGGGLWGYATNLNNIETYACVPPIIGNGCEWFGLIGTVTSPGTKVFSLTGKIVNTGLVEVPMGMTLREIIFDLGGGIQGGKRFKAVQTGGPSGGCLPERFLDLPVNFDSLRKVGSIMGSGGMIVMDEDTCMVEVARYFLAFSQAESCGKCPPCRIGTYRMLQILDRITHGEGVPEDIGNLEKLGKLIEAGSLCGLGQSAASPVLSTLKYFREEFEEHIHDKFCRANVCSGTGIFYINQAECIVCGLCMQNCAFDAVKDGGNFFYIDRDSCTRCKACHAVCPVGAVKIGKQSITRLAEQMNIPADEIETFERRGSMTLKDLLDVKPQEIVYCCTACKIIDAIKKMKEKNVSSILVMDEQKKNLRGIFTERDIMNCIVRNVSLTDETMDRVMTPDPLTLDCSIDVSVAMTLMSDRKIRHLPVKDEENIVGIISYRDLVSYLLPEVVYMAEDV